MTDGDVGVLDPGTGVVRPELAIRLSVEAARRAGAEVRTGVLRTGKIPVVAEVPAVPGDTPTKAVTA